MICERPSNDEIKAAIKDLRVRLRTLARDTSRRRRDQVSQSLVHIAELADKLVDSANGGVRVSGVPYRVSDDDLSISQDW